MHNAIPLIVAVLIAVGIIVIGCFYLLSPERISGTFGLKPPASATIGGFFGCAFATTARASIQKFSLETSLPDTTACPACTSAPGKSAASWLSGVNRATAPKPN
jgi:hypothetical protein